MPALGIVDKTTVMRELARMARNSHGAVSRNLGSAFLPSLYVQLCP